MAKDRFKGTNDYRDGRHAENVDRHTTNILALQERRMQANKIQREVLTELASNPLVRENIRRLIVGIWLPHLNSTPQAVLNWKTTKTVATMAKLAAAIALGKRTPHPLGPERWSVEGETNYLAQAKAKRLAMRPEWMNDPSVLPKRPPGK